MAPSMIVYVPGITSSFQPANAVSVRADASRVVTGAFSAGSASKQVFVLSDHVDPPAECFAYDGALVHPC